MDNIREQDVDGIRVKVELEAEDTLAVKLMSVLAEGPAPGGPVRQVMERQARTIVEQVNYLQGDLTVIEVDGVAEAVQIRSKKPEAGRFVEVILRHGNVITVEARGGSVLVAKDNYDKLVDTLVGLL
jgi:hypothetical protein